MSESRCYLRNEVLQKLQLHVRTFERLRKDGKLPFVEEIKPRIGRRRRFRADLLDRYLAGEWGQSRYFASHKKAQAAAAEQR